MKQNENIINEAIIIALIFYVFKIRKLKIYLYIDRYISEKQIMGIGDWG
jgi:hypothetical protein